MNSLAPYRYLISKRKVAFEARGLKKWGDLPASLFDHQRHGVEFALRAGCAALFYDTGLGKTAQALVWGEQIVRATNKPVLMLAPLAVGPQHAREADRLGIDAKVIRDGSEVTSPRIYIINYDRLDRIDPSMFFGVILDESSILKSFTGATTRALISAFSGTPYRLACTATPAPNDHMELGMTLDARADAIGRVVHAEPDQAWVVWCETNAEADALMARMPKGEYVEVRGDQSADEKESKLVAFSQGDVRIIISKPVLAGFGLNWQHCARQAFIGLSFSYEQYYQAVRRCHRFGQKRQRLSSCFGHLAAAGLSGMDGYRRDGRSQRQVSP